MLEPVSTTIGACWIGFSALQGLIRRNSAVSAEASSVNQATTAIVERAESVQYLFGQKADAISQIDILMLESGSSADGSMCEIKPLAADYARLFVCAMPEHLQMPEFEAAPDGSILLEWDASKYRRLLVTISDSHRLAFAWIDGTESGHGVARFNGLKIPPRILEELNALNSDANPALWAA